MVINSKKALQRETLNKLLEESKVEIKKLPKGPKPKSVVSVKSKNFLNNGPKCVDNWIKAGSDPEK